MTIAKFKTRIDLLEDLIRNARVDGGNHLQDLQPAGGRQNPTPGEEPMEVDDEDDRDERPVGGESMAIADGSVRDGASGTDTADNGLWL